MPNPNSIVVVDPCELVAETADALCIATPVGTPVNDDSFREWIPRSQVDSTDLDEVGDIGYVEIPLWLAEDKDLPYDEHQ